jgi:hypothetical protein
MVTPHSFELPIQPLFALSSSHNTNGALLKRSNGTVPNTENKGE